MTGRPSGVPADAGTRRRSHAPAVEQEAGMKPTGWIVAAVWWFTPETALAQGRGYDWWWEGHPMGLMWGAWGIGMGLMMLVFWGLVIVAIVLGIRWMVGQGKESRSDTALEILRQRYARGEINKEEFEAKKRDLS